jgi:hypothetical protein
MIVSPEILWMIQSRIVSVAGELITAAGDNPDVKEAGRELGHAALIVAKTIKNSVLPLAAINYAIDKARDYFNGRTPDRLAESFEVRFVSARDRKR